MKMKLGFIPLVAIGLVLGSGCAHQPGPSSERRPANANNATNWKFDYAKFTLQDVVNAKTGKSVLDNDSAGPISGNGYSECRVDIAQRDVAVGTVDVHQYSDDTYIRAFRVISIPNVQARVEITGLNIQCHMFRKNSKWSIRNLSGKSVSDIFASKYHGGKLGVSVGASVAVNVNEAVVVNGAGVTITNMEQMFDWGDLGVGVVIGYHSITFDQSNLRARNESVTVTKSLEDGTPQGDSKETFEEAMKIKL